MNMNSSYHKLLFIIVTVIIIVAKRRKRWNKIDKFEFCIDSFDLRCLINDDRWLYKHWSPYSNVLIVPKNPAAPQSVHLACFLLISFLTCCLLGRNLHPGPHRGAKVPLSWKKNIFINLHFLIIIIIILKECNIYELISTKCVYEGRRGSKTTFPPSLKSPLQGYTESNRDTSTGKLFSPPAVRVASVLLAQLFLTIKSAGFKSSGRICFMHSSVRWSWNNNIEKYVE